LNPEQQDHLKAAVQEPPAQAGLELANWNWKVVRQFIQQRFGAELSRSTCLNYLHRLGFVLKRPKKRLLKADAQQRMEFVVSYAALCAAAQRLGAIIFFVDEAHFRADADLCGKWVLRGHPALVDSTSPSLGEKVTYYSAVCLETGAVEVMSISENCTAETSTAFLRQLREKYPQPLFIIWDNSPAHHGEAIRTYLTTPDLKLRLIALPAYSPDFNADEAIWDWAREEVTANTCLSTKAKVQEKIDQFFSRLSERTAEVKRRCRTLLQAQAEALSHVDVQFSSDANHVGFTLALV
jgi:transposase